MSKVIFSTFDPLRKPHCATITRIEIEGGKKYVLKLPLSKQAIPHLQKSFAAYPPLAKALGKVAKPEIYKDGIRFEYIEGQSLSAALTKAFDEGDKKEIESLFGLYKSVIANAQAGDGKLFPIDLDANFDNFILGDGLTLIDYEWPAETPIEEGYLYYRTLGLFYRKRPHSIEEVYSFKQALDFFNVDANRIEAYAKKDEEFHASNVNPSLESHAETNLFETIEGDKKEIERLNKEIERNNISSQKEFDRLNNELRDRGISSSKEIERLNAEMEASNLKGQQEIDRLNLEMQQNNLRGEQEISRLNQEIERNNQESQQEIDRLNHEIERNNQKGQQEIDRLNHEIDRLNHEIVLANIDLQKKNERIEKAENEVRLAMEKYVQAQKQLELALQEVDDKNGRIRQMEKDIHLAQEQLNQTRDELILAQQELDAAKEEANRLNQEIQNKNERIEAVENEIRLANDQLNHAQEELASTQQQLGEARLEIDQSKAEIERIKRSRGYRMLKKWYRLRDWLLPKGSKRRLFVKTGAYCVRHPVIAWRALLHGKAKDYWRTAKSDPSALENKMVNYGARMEESEAPEGLIFFKEKDYQPIVFPHCAKPIVSIIIPVYNQFFYTYNCLKAVLAHTDPKKTPYEVILADDVSTDETVHIKDLVKNIIVARNKKNTGFLLNCNNGAKKAKGKYVYFLNNDTNVQPHYMDELIEYIEAHDDVGAVGSKLVYGNGWLQEAGGIFWKDGSAWNFGNKGDREDPQFNYVKDVDYISGASLLIRHDSFKKLGGFDKEFAPAYCEDSDMCFSLRYKLHQRVVYIPTSVVVHFEGISNGTDLTSGLKKYQVVNTEKFKKKWAKELEDKYPNAECVFHARDLSKDKKTILVIDHYVPQYDKDAGSRTIFTYLELFVAMGFNVKFIGDNFYRHEPYTTVLQKMGIEVLYGPKAFHNWKNIIKEWAPYLDFVFLSRPHISIKYVDFVRENTNAKILYYGHDLHMMRLTREMELTGNKKMQSEIDRFKEMEETLFAKSDKSFFPSSVEVKYLEKAYPDYKFGVLQGFMYEKGPFVEHKGTKDLLFVGGFGHGPNVDAVLYFAKEIWPEIKKAYPSIKFHVVGSNAPEEIKALNGDGIVIHGFVDNDELDRLYQTTSIVVAPLRYGAGIKGKITEAMAKCCPVVMTTCGAEGLDGTESFLKVEDDPKKMAQIIIDLYKDEAARVALAKKQKEYINAHFTFDSARKIFEKELVR